MAFSSILKKSIISACYSFTTIILIYSLIVIAFFDGLGMDPVSVFLFYPLSLFFSLANRIVKYSELKDGAKIAIHFTLITLSLFFFVFLPRKNLLSSGTSVIIFAFYLIVYVICMAIYHIKSVKNKKRQEKRTEYKKVF